MEPHDFEWKDRLKRRQVCRKRPILDVNNLPAKDASKLRIVCISDTHNMIDKIPLIPDGDILVHAGDFTGTGKREEVQKFADFIAALPHRHKVIIAGNHDLTFDSANYPELKKRFHSRYEENYDCEAVKDLVRNVSTYLEDTMVEIEGLKIYGSPWQPVFFDWGFNLSRGEEILEKWKMIPENVDILITHGPPLGYGDLCTYDNRAGCADLLREIEERIKPRYHVFGHIHEGYGIWTDDKTIYVNASTCTTRYKPINEPIVFDIAPR